MYRAKIIKTLSFKVQKLTADNYKKVLSTLRTKIACMVYFDSIERCKDISLHEIFEELGKRNTLSNGIVTSLIPTFGSRCIDIDNLLDSKNIDMNDIDGYLKTIDLVFFIDLFAQIWSSFLEVTYETEYDEKSEKFVSTLDSYFDTLEERYALIE